MSDNIIVTGASGFLGKKLANCLKVSGKSLFQYANSANNGDGYFSIDLTQKLPLDSHIRLSKGIINLAGLAHSNAKISDWPKYKKINIDAPLKLYRKAAEMNLDYFIHISSIKALQSNVHSLSSFEISNPYNDSKKICELELMELSKELSSTKLIIMRPSLIYGPKMKANLAMVSSYIKQAPFVFYPKSDARISLIHIDTLCESIVKVIENFSDQKNIINCFGQVYEVSQIFTQLSETYQKKALAMHIPDFLQKLPFLEKLYQESYSNLCDRIVIENNSISQISFSKYE